jgi:hypothetical protein
MSKPTKADLAFQEKLSAVLDQLDPLESGRDGYGEFIESLILAAEELLGGTFNLPGEVQTAIIRAIAVKWVRNDE